MTDVKHPESEHSMPRLASPVVAVMLAFLLGAIGEGRLARAATAEDDAAAAAREWVKAVTSRDIDSQLKLLPNGLLAKPGERERERKRLEHEKEMALINGEKYVSFDVDPKGTPGKVGRMSVVVFPYRSVMQTKNGRIERQSSLLAIAEEGSSSWSVIDGTAQNPKSMRGFLPGYAGVPPIPKAVNRLIKDE